MKRRSNVKINVFGMSKLCAVEILFVRYKIFFMGLTPWTNMVISFDNGGFPRNGIVLWWKYKLQSFIVLSCMQFAFPDLGGSLLLQ